MEAALSVDRPKVLNIDHLVRQMKERHAIIMQGLGGFVPLPSPPPPIQPLASSTPPPQDTGRSKPEPVSMPKPQPVVIAAQREIAMDLVLTKDYKIASRIKDILVAKNALDFIRRAKLEARALNVFSFFIMWSDLHANESDAYSPLLVNLGDLIECGLSITDIISLGLATSYEQLKSVLKFTPADLCVSYRRFNLSHLVQHYGVTYKHLLFDFKLGMVDYFVKLNLSLENIASIGINIETAMNWRKYRDEAYAEAHMIPPTMGGKSNSQVSGSLLPLDREMLQQRYEKRIAAFDDEETESFIQLNGSAVVRQHNKFDLPKNWNLYMGLDVSHLRTMGVTRKDLDRWWLKPYSLSIDKLLIDVFACEDEVLLRYYRTPASPHVVERKVKKEKSKEKRSKKKDMPKPSQTKKVKHKKPKLKSPTSSAQPPSIASMRALLLLDNIGAEGSRASPDSASASSGEEDSESGYSSEGFSFFESSSSSDDDENNARSRSSSRKPANKNNNNWQENIPNVIDKF